MIKKLIVFVSSMIFICLCFTACSTKSNESKEEVQLNTEAESSVTDAAIKELDKKDYNTALNSDKSIKQDESNAINLNKYLTIEFEGYSGAGYAIITFDREQFYIDNINIVVFKGKNEEDAYRQLHKDYYGYPYSGKPVEVLYNMLAQSYSASGDGNLSNGDTLEVTWSIPDKVEKYFDIPLDIDTLRKPVEGLLEAEQFDPFGEIEIKFSGIEPNGIAEIDVKENWDLYGYYRIDKTEGLKNGDAITVYYGAYDSEEANHSGVIIENGKRLSRTKQEIIVSGLDHVPGCLAELPLAFLDKVNSTYIQFEPERWQPCIAEQIVDYCYETNPVNGWGNLYVIYKVDSVCTVEECDFEYTTYQLVEYGMCIVKENGEYEIRHNSSGNADYLIHENNDCYPEFEGDYWDAEDIEVFNWKRPRIRGFESIEEIKQYLFNRCPDANYEYCYSR